MGAHVRWGATMPCKQRAVGSIPTVSTAIGLLVQGEDAGIAGRKLGFDSPGVHYRGPIVQREDASLADWKFGFKSRWVHSSAGSGRRTTPMVKRTSSLSSNEALRVRLLLGVLTFL